MSVLSHSRKSTPARPRELTGRVVLACLLGFFAVVATVNAVMMTLAVTTFGGVETASSYQAGLRFAGEEAAASAQQARAWRVTAAVRQRAGLTDIELNALDAAGQPLAGLDASILLAHPTNRRLDQALELRPDGAGRYRGRAELPPGQWDIVIELARDAERLFRSRERVVLR